MSAKASDYQHFIGRAKTALLTPTGADILGPFYLPGSPVRFSLVEPFDAGPTLSISGRITDVLGVPLQGVVMDIWQADQKGVYDLVGSSHRGIVHTEADGVYQFETVLPGDYDISDLGAPQPHDFRCAHIHFILSRQGIKALTTQLYFPDDRYNATDHWFDAKRMLNFRADSNEATFGFVLERS